jgi:RNA polymerase sigma-70 factor (ECF subfamily)
LPTGKRLKVPHHSPQTTVSNSLDPGKSPDVHRRGSDPLISPEPVGMPDRGTRNVTSEEVFAAATRPLLGHLVAVARRILGDEDTAWDAVQEALLSLWTVGEMPSKVRAWMVRAVVYRSLHLSRCRSRRRRHEDQARIGRLEESDRDDPTRHLEREELRRILREALSEIAPDHRSVLVLSVIEQMDYESIAATLGVPIGTVRSRLNRSRKALREVLTKMFPEGYHGLY